MKAYKFAAEKEDVRQPRIVRVGAIQNSIAIPTTEPVSAQIKAIYEKIGKIIDGAALAGVNVLCLQEAWSKSTWIEILTHFNWYNILAMPFGFCTREKKVWCEFAELAEQGPSTQYLKDVRSNLNLL